MHLRLVDLLREVGARSLIHSECAVDASMMEQAPAEAIIRYIRDTVVRQLCEYVVDNRILNDPDCIQMRHDLPTDSTRYRARIYMLAPKELEALLQKAFEVGRDSRKNPDKPYDVP